MMKKLKTKYKWSEREKHFQELAFNKKLAECMIKNFEAMFNMMNKFNTKSRETYGYAKLIHFSEKEEKELKSSAHLADKSALEIEGGTTNP